MARSGIKVHFETVPVRLGIKSKDWEKQVDKCRLPCHWWASEKSSEGIIWKSDTNYFGKNILQIIVVIHKIIFPLFGF